MKRLLTKALSLLLTVTVSVATVDLNVCAVENTAVEGTKVVEEEVISVEEERSIEETEVIEETTIVENTVVKEEEQLTEETVTKEEEQSTEEIVTEEEEQSTEEIVTEEEEQLTEEITTEVEEQSTEETTTEVVKNGWDGVTTQDVYVAKNFKVTFNLDSYWNGAYNASIKIENTSNVVIQDWYLSCDCECEITNIWNAVIQEKKEEGYVIKNASWNQDIPVGGSVEFGFSGNGNFAGFPTAYELLGEKAQVSEEAYSIEYYLDSDWGNGFTGRISITNNTDTTLEDWVLVFDFDREITSVWNGVIELQEDNHYAVMNAGYNSNILANQTVSFGFCGQEGSAENKPYNVQLFTYDVYSQKYENPTVTFDFNYDGMIEVQNVEKGVCATRPDTSKREGYFFMGWYTDKELTNYFDIDNTPINEDITLYAEWLYFTDETDTDQDGIIDALEELFGTDKTKADTDGDGLSDYLEINLFETKPLKADSDGNGVLDGDEDKDADGLSNLNEVSKETNPQISDTDEDGLSDGEEVNNYGTNPLQKDTDGDGVSDGKEIELQTNPLVAEESFEIIEYAEDGLVNASVEITLAGEQVESLSVDKVINETLFPENMPGYVGEAYDFSVNGEFDSAVISFAFDDSLLEEEGFTPIIYYFNEEEQQLEALETTVHGNVASAKVEHFSTYILMNKTVYEDSFEWQEVWDTTGYTDIEIVLVIDDSGSLGGDYGYNSSTGVFTGGMDPEHKRLEVARNFVDNASERAKIGIVKFDGVIDDISGGIIECTQEGKEQLKDYLQFTYKSSGSYNISGIFDSRGTTYMYGGIEKAIGQLSKDSDNTLKVLIVFTDGMAHDYSKHSSVISKANSNDVKIFTVGLGSSSSSYFTRYLKPLAEKTSGAFYMASNADELTKIYDDINEKIDIETDSDGDGIADYYEENMTIFNGVKMPMDKNNVDSDGDGLTDGEEVSLKYEYNEDKTQVRVTGVLKSNPTRVDSDGDGLYDGTVRKTEDNSRIIAPKDPNPLVTDGPVGVWDNHVYQQNYGEIGTQYSSDFGLKVPELKELIADTVAQEMLEEYGIVVPNNKEIADVIVEFMLKLRQPVNDIGNQEWVRNIILFIKNFSNGKLATVAGAYLLNFVLDEDGVAYHSQPDTWQRDFGYNDLYDDAFRIGSVMNFEKFEFSTDAEDYVLWMWKGDYWNLHSGAEIGLYDSPEVYSENPHYDVVDFELPMTLSLYNYYGKNQIDTIFNWVPEVNQWWVTGFSGQHPDYMKPNPDVMVSVGSIDFTGYEDMYEALKEADKGYALNEQKERFRKYLIFDDDNKTVWVYWYEGVI